MAQQKVICQVLGNPKEARLWWMQNGVMVGNSVDSEPFAVEMAVGTNEVTCVSAEGVSASVRFFVREE